MSGTYIIGGGGGGAGREYFALNLRMENSILEECSTPMVRSYRKLNKINSKIELLGSYRSSLPPPLPRIKILGKSFLVFFFACQVSDNHAPFPAIHFKKQCNLL